MKLRTLKKTCCILLVVFSAIYSAENIDITVLYNNIASNKNVTTAWGFSCVIEKVEETILFDTGGDGDILLSNMKKLGIRPADIDILVISHIHADHSGGIWAFVEKKHDVNVYIPSAFPQSFKEKAKKRCGELVSVKKPVKICENVSTTGELGTRPKEQSLVIRTKKGLVIVTGCAHPGIANIVRFAKQHFGEKIHLVFGGFHLMAYSRKDIMKIIGKFKKMGVTKVGPSHCTGGKAISLFRKHWGEDFVNLGCGAHITIK